MFTGTFLIEALPVRHVVLPPDPAHRDDRSLDLIGSLTNFQQSSFVKLVPVA